MHVACFNLNYAIHCRKHCFPILKIFLMYYFPTLVGFSFSEGLVTLCVHNIRFIKESFPTTIYHRQNLIKTVPQFPPAFCSALFPLPKLAHWLSGWGLSASRSYDVTHRGCASYYLIHHVDPHPGAYSA